MVEKRDFGLWLAHGVLLLGVAVVCLPIYLTFVGSTATQEEIIHPPLPLTPGPHLWENYGRALGSGVNAPVWRMLLNSTIMATGIAAGKIAISIVSAYAIVYFRFPFRMLAFWTIFMTLMLPVEVRIVPTYEVIANFKMLNSYQGLILPTAH